MAKLLRIVGTEWVPNRRLSVCGGPRGCLGGPPQETAGREVTSGPPGWGPGGRRFKSSLPRRRFLRAASRTRHKRRNPAVRKGLQPLLRCRFGLLRRSRRSSFSGRSSHAVRHARRRVSAPSRVAYRGRVRSGRLAFLCVAGRPLRACRPPNVLRRCRGALHFGLSAPREKPFLAQRRGDTKPGVVARSPWM
jgi:hypothetical protein